MPERFQTPSTSLPRAARRGERPARGRAMRVATGIFDGPARSAVAARDRTYRRLLICADAIAAMAAILVAVDLFGNDRLRPAAFLAAPIAVAVSKVIGLYDRDELVLTKSTLDESPQLFQLAALYALLFTILQTRLVEGELGAQQIVGVWGLLFIGALVCRFGARALAGSMTLEERCVLVGDLAITNTVGEKLRREGSRQVLAARLELDFEGDRNHALDRVRRAITDHDAHRIILAPQTADSDAVLDAIRLAKSLGVKVSLLPRLFEVVGSSVVFDDLDGVTVLGVRRFGLTRSSAAVKRAMDLVVAGVGVMAVAPVLALIAVLVRMDSPGPLFFRQARVGRDGHHFEMLKFRSMVHGADAERDGLKAQAGQDDEMFKLVDDPRVTRVGRLLRATSLDELPQFFNVLRGDMSLVGPRPLVPDEDELIQGWHRRRLHLVPGMTGPWQVLGSTRVPLQEMVKIDYLYIANWSLWRDVKIMLRTVAHVVRRDGL